MQVTFYGVRGSTPCHGDDTHRYGGNTSCVGVASPASSRSSSTSAPVLRYFGATHAARRLVPRHAACCRHLHWDHTQGLPFFTPMLCPGAELDVYAPQQDDGRSLAEVFDDDDLPAGVPGHDRPVPRHGALPRHSNDDDFADRRREGAAAAGAARRADARLPRRVGRPQRRLPERPPAARTTARFAVTDGALRAGRGRRPADPRLAVHRRRVPGEEQLGSLHDRLRGVAGAALRRAARWRCSTTTRPAPTTRSTSCTAARGRRSATATGCEVVAAYEGLTVELH